MLWYSLAVTVYWATGIAPNKVTSHSQVTDSTLVVAAQWTHAVFQTTNACLHVCVCVWMCVVHFNWSCFCIFDFFFCSLHSTVFLRHLGARLVSTCGCSCSWPTQLVRVLANWNFCPFPIEQLINCACLNLKFILISKSRNICLSMNVCITCTESYVCIIESSPVSFTLAVWAANLKSNDEHCQILFDHRTDFEIAVNEISSQKCSLNTHRHTQAGTSGK